MYLTIQTHRIPSWCSFNATSLAAWGLELLLLTAVPPFPIQAIHSTDGQKAKHLQSTLPRTVMEHATWWSLRTQLQGCGLPFTGIQFPKGFRGRTWVHVNHVIFNKNEYWKGWGGTREWRWTKPSAYREHTDTCVRGPSWDLPPWRLERADTWLSRAQVGPTFMQYRPPTQEAMLQKEGKAKIKCQGFHLRNKVLFQPLLICREKYKYNLNTIKYPRWLPDWKWIIKKHR